MRLSPAVPSFWRCRLWQPVPPAVALSDENQRYYECKNPRFDRSVPGYNRVTMRNWRLLVALWAMVSAAWAADQPAAAITNCANGIPGAPACVISPQAQQEARKAFGRGMKLQKHKRLDEALEEFEKAGNLAPKDVQYATLRELVRQQLVYEHLQRGNAALADGQQIEALGEFRNVLHLDPSNDFARQRLIDAVDHKGAAARQSPRLIEDSDEVRLVPRDNLQSFHFRGDSRQLLIP